MRRCDDQLYSVSGKSATASLGSIRGGKYMFTLGGTLGGATIALQYKYDGTNFATITNGYSNTAMSYTAAACVSGVDLPAGEYQVSVTGGAGVSINASLIGLG